MKKSVLIPLDGSPFSRLIMGSVAEQVLRRLTIPVLLVRPFAEET